MSQPTDKTELAVLALTGAGHFLTHFLMLTFPSLANPLAADIGVSYGTAIGLSFGGYLLFGLGALPAGLLADRVSLKPILLLNMLGMGASCGLIALARSPGEVELGLLSLGLFASLYHPAAMTLLSRTARPGRGIGINGVLGNLGIALAPLCTDWLTGARDWRVAYLVFGAAAVLLGLSFIGIRLDGLDAAPKRETKQVESGQGIRWWHFAVLCLAMCLGGLSYRGNTIVHPRYFEQAITVMSFGWSTSLIYLVGMGGQLFGGYLADRYEMKKSFLLMHLFSLPLLFLMARLVDVPLLACAAGYAFFSYSTQPLENCLVARYTPDRLRSTGYGIKFILTFGVGALMAKFVEWHELHYPIHRIFYWFAGIVTLIVVVSLFWNLINRIPDRLYEEPL